MEELRSESLVAQRSTSINIHQSLKHCPQLLNMLILCQENAYDIYRMYRYIFSPYIEEAGWSSCLEASSNTSKNETWLCASVRREMRAFSGRSSWIQSLSQCTVAIFCMICGFFRKNISFLFASLGEVSLWSDKIGVQPWDLRILRGRLRMKILMSRWSRLISCRASSWLLTSTKNFNRDLPSNFCSHCYLVSENVKKNHSWLRKHPQWGFDMVSSFGLLWFLPVFTSCFSKTLVDPFKTSTSMRKLGENGTSRPQVELGQRVVPGRRSSASLNMGCDWETGWFLKIHTVTRNPYSWWGRGNSLCNVS